MFSLKCVQVLLEHGCKMETNFVNFRQKCTNVANVASCNEDVTVTLPNVKIPIAKLLLCQNIFVKLPNVNISNVKP